MSRAYRIRVSESLRKVIKASDRVTSTLEILAVVSPEETAEILGAELAARGFHQDDEGRWIREEGEITITVDACTAEIEVKSSVASEFEAETDRTSWHDTDNRPNQERVEAQLREDARQGLERKAQEEEKRLERTATDKLERRLRDLQPEIDQVINRVTAEGLKRKASRLGQIKEITEDSESGNVTIVVEV
jgi:hypothetical protein